MLSLIRSLVAEGKARVSEHGFRELREDGISLADLVQSVGSAEVVEEYPDYHKGPCVLLLHRDAAAKPVHVLWGTAKDHPEEATLVTAYRPDPSRWSKDFMRRIPK
jgi:hypothetical protein